MNIFFKYALIIKTNLQFPTVQSYSFQQCKYFLNTVVCTYRIVPAQMGRLVCQYMKSVWECLHILVSYQPAFRSASSILDSAFECFSVSSGQSDVPIMLTVEKIMNEVLLHFLYCLMVTRHGCFLANFSQHPFY